MTYYFIISLPLLFYFYRLITIKYIVPFYTKKPLIAELKQRKNWKQIEEANTFLKKLYKRDHAEFSSVLYRAINHISNKDFVYGEINFLSFYSILERAKPQAEEVFYDLGSGSGKAVFAAALFFNFGKCCGIELVPPLHKQTIERLNKAKRLLEKDKSESVKDYEKKLSVIEFINGNIFESKFDDADIIYIAATCFSDTTWTSLVERLSTLKPGTRIIVTTKTIQHKGFKILYEGKELMSWGLSLVSVYIII